MGPCCGKRTEIVYGNKNLVPAPVVLRNLIKLVGWLLRLERASEHMLTRAHACTLATCGLLGPNAADNPYGMQLLWLQLLLRCCIGTSPLFSSPLPWHSFICLSSQPLILPTLSFIVEPFTPRSDPQSDHSRVPPRSFITHSARQLQVETRLL